jgi:GDPmannose 4,6-dehydratase
MWLMVQQPEPDDYVLATGKSLSVRAFATKAFERIGVRLAWRGEGVDEVGFDADSGAVRVAVDRRYFRPTEVDALIGDATKARERLGWRHEIDLDALVAEMVTEDLRILATGAPHMARE